jgi:N-acetylmuramoyl-L-alanine amidase
LRFIHWTKTTRTLAVLFVPLAALAAAAQQEPPALSLPQSTQVPAVPTSGRPQVQPQFVVVLDAAHGGADTGARISDKVLEKDLVLALSTRLRAALSSRGISVITTRETDAAVPPLHRAETANHALAAACITLHVTATGSGVHLFTSSLSPSPNSRFLPWLTAQSAYVTQSLKLSSEISSSLAHVSVPVTLGRTSLQPLDSFACPAVAVEIAPLQAGNSTKSAPLTDESYQNKIVDALTTALAQWKNDWRQP